MKFDRAMVVKAVRNRRARHLLSSLVRLIRESGCLVLIEGVEDYEQAAIALDTEADMFQGYFFGRPAPLHANTDSDARQEESLGLFDRQYRQAAWLQTQPHEDFLKLLRYELLAACHELARNAPLPSACAGLVDLPGIARCFLEGQLELPSTL